MMPSSAFRRVFCAFLLTYLSVISSIAPLAKPATGVAKVKGLRSTQERLDAPYRPGELLVRFRSGVTRLEKELIISTQGAHSKKDLRGESGVEKLELLGGRDARAAALDMLMNPQVEFVEPNFLIGKDDVVPNDDQFNEQWALRNTGQSGGQFGSDVNAIGAWKTTTGSKSTVIAVIDSGIDFTHPDLANNQWLNRAPGVNGDVHGWDYVDDSAEIKDEQGTVLRSPASLRPKVTTQPEQQE